MLQEAARRRRRDRRPRQLRGVRRHPRRQPESRPARSPVSDVVKDKPIINVSGCPPIPVVITGVLTQYLTFGKLPELDALGRPEGLSTARRSTTAATGARSTNAASSPTASTTKARGRAGASTSWAAGDRRRYNACATVKWNDGTSFPIEAGPRLHRLFRARLLGQGRLLPAAVHRPLGLGTDGRHGGRRGRGARRGVGSARPQAAEGRGGCLR